MLPSMVTQHGPRWQRLEGSRSIASILSGFSDGFGYMRFFFLLIADVGFADGATVGISSAQRGRIGALEVVPTIWRGSSPRERGVAAPHRSSHTQTSLPRHDNSFTFSFLGGSSDLPSKGAPYGRMERPTGAAPHHPRPTGAPHTLIRISRSRQVLPDGMVGSPFFLPRNFLRAYSLATPSAFGFFPTHVCGLGHGSDGSCCWVRYTFSKVGGWVWPRLAQLDSNLMIDWV